MQKQVTQKSRIHYLKCMNEEAIYLHEYTVVLISREKSIILNTFNNLNASSIRFKKYSMK